MDFDPSAIVEAQPPTPGTPTPPDEPMPPGFQQRPSLYEWYNMSPAEKQEWRDNSPVGLGYGPPDVVWGPADGTYTVDDIPMLEAQGETGMNAGVLEQLYKIRDQYAAWDRGEKIPVGMPQPEPLTPVIPPTSTTPATTPTTPVVTTPTPEPPMPPDVFPGEPEQTAQPTKEEFMERLMQMIQALKERSQPAPQAAPPQQWAPPPPRPPVAAFNMGNASAPMAAPTMPQMFNSGPGFFTPQQRGPIIDPSAIPQQQIPMSGGSPYKLDFSSFLRNR